MPKLTELPFVASANMNSSFEGIHQVTVSGTDKSDIGENLFKSVVDNGWSLSEMKHEETSLEDVFTQLTRG